MQCLFLVVWHHRTGEQFLSIFDHGNVKRLIDGRCRSGSGREGLNSLAPAGLIGKQSKRWVGPHWCPRGWANPRETPVEGSMWKATSRHPPTFCHEMQSLKEVTRYFRAFFLVHFVIQSLLRWWFCTEWTTRANLSLPHNTFRFRLIRTNISIELQTKVSTGCFYKTKRPLSHYWLARLFLKGLLTQQLRYPF